MLRLVTGASRQQLGHCTRSTLAGSMRVMSSSVVTGSCSSLGRMARILARLGAVIRANLLHAEEAQRLEWNEQPCTDDDCQASGLRVWSRAVVQAVEQRIDVGVAAVGIDQKTAGGNNRERCRPSVDARGEGGSHAGRVSET